MQPARPPSPVIWLRLEGVAILLVATVAYGRVGGNWLLFGILFLSPDISLFAYLRGPRFGAMIYNAAHNYVVPILLGFTLLAASKSISFPLIWIAHIGFDRVLGYGLKYPDSFGHTHLGMSGRPEPSSETNRS